MIMRIATFNRKPDVDPATYEQFRAWMGSQPGVVAGYHVHDPQSEKYLSISIWESKEAVLAMKDRQFPGGPLGLKPDSVVLCDVESTFGPNG